MSEKTKRNNSSRGKSSGSKGKKSSKVLAVRYNNPGCVRDLKKRYYLDPETNQMKTIIPQKGTNGYTIYATKEDGMTALALLLKRYQAQGRDTVQRIVSIYASKRDGANTKKYISDVCGALKVSPNQKLDMDDPLVLKTLMRTITEIEGGKQSLRYFGDTIYDTALTRVYSGHNKEQNLNRNVEKENPFFIQRPGIFARVFTKKGNEDYKKWLQLYNTVVCKTPDGQSFSLLDLGRAVQEGQITLEHASYIASAAAQSADKSYTSINQVLSKMMPKKQAQETLKKVVDQPKNGCAETLRQNASSTSLEQQNHLILKDNQYN